MATGDLCDRQQSVALDAPSVPIPLTPIERFWLAEDVPSSCLSFFHKYTLDHEVEARDVLEALEHTAPRHPLPFCQIYQGPGDQEFWQASQVALCELVRAQSPEPYAWVPRIQIDQQPGLRVWHSQRAIWFEYHHTCADGRGALQLERDFFAHYRPGGQPSAGQPQPFAKQGPGWAHLAARGRARITFRGGLFRTVFGPTYLWRGLNADVLPFPEAAPPRRNRVAMRAYSQRLSPQATDRVRQLARAHQVSVNDWVLVQIARAIAERVPEGMCAKHALRLVIPVDLRTHHGDIATCANRMSFVYLDLPRHRVDASTRFASWVSKRMRFLKRYMGLVAWRSIQFGPKRLAELQGYLHHREQMLTCYVSNLGVMQGLPTCVQAFEATPTLRRDTPLALMVYTLHDQLQITVGYDQTRVNTMRARELVRQLLLQLSTSS